MDSGPGCLRRRALTRATPPSCSRRTVTVTDPPRQNQRKTHGRIDIANPSVTVPPSWLPRLSPRRRRRRLRQRRGTRRRAALAVWPLERINSDRISNTLTSRQTSSYRTISSRSTTTRAHPAAVLSMDATPKVTNVITLLLKCCSVIVVLRPWPKVCLHQSFVNARRC